MGRKKKDSELSLLKGRGLRRPIFRQQVRVYDLGFKVYGLGCRV